MKRIICIILMLILFSPYYVSAEECNKEEKQKIYSLINNINITYTHKGNNTFDINIYNIPEQLYVVDFTDKVYYSNSTSSVITDVVGGKRYNFRIFSTSNDPCVNNMNYTKSIYINKYNKYSEKVICQNEKYKDFKYCNSGYQGNITDESFEKELKKYENKLAEEIPVEEINDTNNLFNNSIFLITVVTISVLLILSIIIYFIRSKKNRRIKL